MSVTDGEVLSRYSAIADVETGGPCSDWRT